eukprot:2731887-Pleurochrysis_carterae.AAC.1
MERKVTRWRTGPCGEGGTSAANSNLRSAVSAPPRPVPLRRLPSPEPSRTVRQRKMQSEPAGSSRVTRSQSRTRATAGLPSATVEPLPA